MKTMILFCQIMLAALTVRAQQSEKLLFGDTLTKEISKGDHLRYSLNLEAGGIYQFVLRQLGIGVYYNLMDHTGKIGFESDTPEDLDDVERFDYEAVKSGSYTLTIERFERPGNTLSGRFQLSVKALGAAELSRRRETKKELMLENQKIVQTLDIDHFWEAFDQLKGSHNRADSCAVIQHIYLDRATDGLKDFIRVRDLTAEKYVQMIARYPKFLQSIRERSFEAKNWQPEIERIFSNAVCPLLSQSLREGTADFIGELVSGHAYTGNHSYGDAHEAVLWDEFKRQLCSNKTSDWLYNYTTVKDRPADLGYYIGYRIARSYYEHAADKKNAISQIIKMKDPKAFLEGSGYSPRTN